MKYAFCSCMYIWYQSLGIGAIVKYLTYQNMHDNAHVAFIKTSSQKLLLALQLSLQKATAVPNCLPAK